MSDNDGGAHVIAHAGVARGTGTAFDARAVVREVWRAAEQSTPDELRALNDALDRIQSESLSPAAAESAVVEAAPSFRGVFRLTPGGAALAVAILSLALQAYATFKPSQPPVILNQHITRTTNETTVNFPPDTPAEVIKQINAELAQIGAELATERQSELPKP